MVVVVQIIGRISAPRRGSRSQVREIQSAGACVLGYLSIGEDLRTAGMTPEDMLKDWRFTGDGSGPRVDGVFRSICFFV